MKSIIVKLLDGVLWIWSHLPICCLSDDSNFATLNSQNFKCGKIYRFSLLNIMLGGYIYYVGTFKLYRGACYIKKLCFSRTYSLYLPEYKEKAEKHIEKITKDFRKHIKTLPAEDLQIEKEKLLYHIEQQNQRLETSLNKANAFTTAILAIAPITASTIIKKDLDSVRSVMIGIYIYVLLNIFIFIFEIIKVNSYRRSTFAYLKSAPDKKREIMVQYYYDWQNLKITADTLISYVCNLQEWIIFAIVMLGCTYLLCV